MLTNIDFRRFSKLNIIKLCCCEDLCCNLIEKVECKLAIISCKINEHEKIGRKTSQLYN